METNEVFADLAAIEHLTRINTLPKELLLEVLSKIEYGTSASECSIKIVALLRILKREAACLDLMSLFSVETVAKLCRVWLNLMQRHPGIDELRANVKRIIPGPEFILDLKLCLVYDFWTGNPSAETEQIEAFIEEVFQEPSDTQKASRDECMRAAQNKKDPFRSEIWAIASRSTINERLLTYSTAALNLLGEKTLLERVVDGHLAGRHRLSSDNNPIYAEFLGGHEAAPEQPVNTQPVGSSPPNNVLVTRAGLQASNPVGAHDSCTTELTNNHSQPQSSNATLDPGSQTISASDQTLSETDSGRIPTKKSPRKERSRKRRSNNPWTSEEVSLLKLGVAKHGQGSWAKIHHDNVFTVLSRRSQVDLKDKWRNLCRRKSADEIDIMLTDIEDGDLLTSSVGGSNAGDDLANTLHDLQGW